MGEVEANVIVDWEYVSSHLTCPLCQGLYRDAHTISECLHTFCKGCLMKELTFKSVRGSIACPTCSTALGHIQSIHTKIVHDRNLQSIVDKLFPEFDEQERGFVRQLTIGDSRKRGREDNELHKSPVHKKTQSNSTAVAQINSGLAPPIAVEVEYTFSMEPDVACSEDNILPPLVRPQFQGPLNLKVAKVLSFVAKRIAPLLSSPIEKEDIDVYFNGVFLDPQKTLKQCIGSFIVQVGAPLKLHYRRRER
ncbi:hypothetical protein EON65_12115 [archaeon]|nr:MAG: hypothetical protein EON65_12115 [archaeon]